MKNVLLFALALCISTTVATAVMTQDKSADVNKWAGAVVSVDSDTKTIVAKNKKGEMSFDVAAASFDKGVPFDSLKVGDRTALAYELKTAKMQRLKQKQTMPKTEK